MSRKLAVYRPSSKDITKGYAFQFAGKESRGKYVLFIDATKQVKEKPEAGSEESPFDWKSKVTVMLNSGELATLAISILDGVEATFQHKTAKGSSTTKFTPPGERSKDWFVSVNTTRGEIRNSVSGFISHGNVYTLKLIADQLILDDTLLGEVSENASRPTAVGNS